MAEHSISTLMKARADGAANAAGYQQHSGVTDTEPSTHGQYVPM